MTRRTIRMTLPADVFAITRTDEVNFVREFRLAAAVKWYEIGMVSQERAAALAGLSREGFLLGLTRFKVSPFQVSADEILEEASGDESLGA